MGVMAPGLALTVATMAELQPPGNVYRISEEPAVTPVTIPLPDTVATAGLLLDHEPPDVPSSRVVLYPTHTNGAPVIRAGTGLTVSNAVTEEPAVYVTVTIPAERPLTTPDEPMVATDVLLLDHEPPLVESLSVTDDPAHKLKPALLVIAPTWAYDAIPNKSTKKVRAKYLILHLVIAKLRHSDLLIICCEGCLINKAYDLEQMLVTRSIFFCLMTVANR